MLYEFKFPDVGEGIHEGELVKWLVKEGDVVSVDAHIAEVETDKAIVEMPSPKKGKIAKLHFKEGDTIIVGQVFVTIETDEAASQPSLAPVSHSAPQSQHQSKPAAAAAPEEKYTGSVVGFVQEAKDVSPIYGVHASSSVANSTNVSATLAVRQLAKQKNVDLGMIKGSGPDGRITEHDVLNAVKVGAAPLNKTPISNPASSTGPTATSHSMAPSTSDDATKAKHVRKYDFYGYLDRQPLKGIKKKVAEHMSASFYTAPQVTNFHSADITTLEKKREEQNKEGAHLTTLAYITRAVSIALQKHPIINSMIEGDDVVMKKYYNIGIAVDSQDGLIVPVVKRANTKTIAQIGDEIKKLATDARERKLNLMDLKGGSFSISNLGMFGVEHFTPILNFPESALLGIGATKPELRIIEKTPEGQLRIAERKTIPLSLTYDHRVISGADASKFMKDLIELLEKPELIENASTSPAGH